MIKVFPVNDRQEAVKAIFRCLKFLSFEMERLGFSKASDKIEEAIKEMDEQTGS